MIEARALTTWHGLLYVVNTAGRAVHTRQLDYLVLSPNSSEKPRGPAHNSRRPSLVKFLLTSQWKIIIRADPPCPADKSRKSVVAPIHKATSEFDEFPMISRASSPSVKPPGESARGFVPDSRLRRGREDIFSGKGGKKEWREGDGEETSHLSCCANVMEFLPTSIEHLAQKVAHYRRGTSRTPALGTIWTLEL